MDKTYTTKTIQIKDIKKLDDSSYLITDNSNIEYSYNYPDIESYTIGDFIDITYTEPVGIFRYPTIQYIIEDRPDSEILDEIGIDQYGFTNFR